MEDLISVIIPVYKVEDYIKDCINSVLDQTYTKLEIILVDDGSPDNCGKICDEYAIRDQRIKVIHKQNGGLSDARNAGLDVAKGKYIVFIDSDDSVTKDYVMYLYKMLIKNANCEIAVCGVKVVQKNEKIIEEQHTQYIKFSSEQALENLLYDNGIRICSYAKMYKIDLFDDLRFPVGEVYEDSATTYKLFDKCSNIIFGDKKCYFYYTRVGSISKKGKFNENEKYYIKNTREMLDFINTKYPNIKNATRRYKMYSNFRILRMLIFTKPRDRKHEKKLIHEIKKDSKLVLKDLKTPKRDKIAIVSLKLGLPFFKLLWFLYSKLTGRVL